MSRASPVEPSGGFSHAWRALRHRNYRLFFSGQSISLIGTWMTRVATTWLVYRLTQSALLLGLVAFSSQIAAFLLAPVAGVWVERLERRKVMVWTQVFSALQSLALGVLTLMKVITVHEIIALSVVQGLINAFDVPARQSMVVQMIDDREDLANAIALNSSMVNGGRIIGPSIAGIVIGLAGEGWCFMIDGASYLAVIASLLLMNIPPLVAKRKGARLLKEMHDGWRYVSTSVPIRTVLLFFVLVSLTAFPQMVLMPIFAADILHGNATTLGWLTGATGVGALMSAASLAVRRSVVGLARMLVVSSLVLGASLILFALSTHFALSLLLCVFTGFGLMQGASACNTILQTVVEEGMRARVLSYYTMAFFGAAPIGSLGAGALAHRIGAPNAVIVAGIACLVGTLALAGKTRLVHESLLPKEPLREAA